MAKKIDFEGLSNKQVQAISYIIEGKTDQETAQAVGVSRSTVNIWRNKDPHFKLALNSIRAELMARIQNTAEANALKAHELIAKAINKELESEEPNANIAIQYLKVYTPNERQIALTVEDIEREEANKEFMNSLSLPFSL